MSPESFEVLVTNVCVNEPEAKALLYLANYYHNNLKNNQAILCATRLEDYPGPKKEQGKGLLRDVRSRMDQKAGDGRVQGGGGGRSTARSRSPMTPTMLLQSSRRSSTGAELSFEFSP